MEIKLNSTYLELLKEDLKTTLKELNVLKKSPENFVYNYFSMLRATIDGTTERLLHVTNESDKIERINKMHEWITYELIQHEKQCLVGCSKYLEQNSAEIDKTYANIKEKISGKFKNSKNDVHYDYKVVSLEIEAALNKLRGDLLLNQTFLFVKTSVNGYGLLIHFQDNYLSSHEIKCFKELSTIGLLTLADFVRKTFQIMEKSVNEQSVVPFEIPKAISKNLFVLWKFLDFVKKNKTLERSKFIIRINKSVLKQTVDSEANSMENSDEASNSSSTESDEEFDAHKMTRTYDVYSQKYFPNELTIDLSKCGIDIIQNNALEYFANIKVLTLAYNNIEKIEKETFSYLRNLGELYLNNNAISTIDKEAFENLKQLVSLNLSNNKLENIEPGTFDQQENLKRLYLGSNLLQRIECEILSKLIKLKELYISVNDIITNEMDLVKCLSEEKAELIKLKDKIL